MSIQDAKQRVSENYLGRFGIESVGLSQDAIEIHSTRTIAQDIVESIKEIVSPWELKVFENQDPLMLQKNG